MIHFVLQPSTAQQLQPQQETRRLRHYWILANGKISMYNEYNDGATVFVNDFLCSTGIFTQFHSMMKSLRDMK